MHHLCQSGMQQQQHRGFAGVCSLQRCGASGLDSVWRPLGTYRCSISILVHISSPICCIQGLLDARVAFAVCSNTNENKIMGKSSLTEVLTEEIENVFPVGLCFVFFFPEGRGAKPLYFSKDLGPKFL